MNGLDGVAGGGSSVIPEHKIFEIGAEHRDPERSYDATSGRVQRRAKSRQNRDHELQRVLGVGQVDGRHRPHLDRQADDGAEQPEQRNQIGRRAPDIRVGDRWANRLSCFSQGLS